MILFETVHKIWSIFEFRTKEDNFKPESAGVTFFVHEMASPCDTSAFEVHEI